MGTLRRFLQSLSPLGFGLVLCCTGGGLTHAEQPAGTAATGDAPVPQGNFLSTLAQAFKQDFEHQVVRGHFDVGAPPDAVHRYYCLVDAKTGKRQASGVAGEPFQRPDGMTGIKGTAVSLYSCAGSEQQGLLVTTGYQLLGAAGAQAAAPVAAAPPSTPQGTTAPPAASPAMPAPVAAPAAIVASSPHGVDVAGVQLGMSVDEVRAVLKGKKLLDYHESTQTLGHLGPVDGTAAPATGAYFVNSVAAWTSPVDGDGEAYDVMFTPVPGKERAMAIIHSMAYSPAHAVRLSALTSGLLKKYGGYTGSDGLPTAPTWRVQHNATVQVGDSCKRRGLFGGLATLGAGTTNRPNVALKTTPEEFRYQLDLCGVAIVTEDHVMVNAPVPHEERGVARFTVTAYSPSIGFEGATAAAQLMQAGTASDAVENDKSALAPRPAAAPSL